MTGPFDLDDDAAYQAWRAAKLADYPTAASDLLVTVADPQNLTDAEHTALCARVAKANMAIYQGPAASDRDAEAGKAIVTAIAGRFGLVGLEGNLCADEDGITPLQVDSSGQRARYIPYTDKPLNWHTDGYYNVPEKRLCAMTLHCVEPAARGGENGLLDPEIAYLLMRDEDPALIEAFQHPNCMAIPANEDAGGDVRDEVTGPVFSVLDDGSLYMRYTARGRNIRWRDDPATDRARAFLTDLLAGDSPYIVRHRLAAGEGLICNNVLHMRTGFADSDAPGHARLMLRGRFYERISTHHG